MAKTATVSLDKLTPEQKAELLKELETQQKEQSQRIREERSNYKLLVDDVVTMLFPELQEASEKLSMVKTKVFSDLNTLVKMKAELYDREEDQFSHSFTTSDGLLSITIGRNVSDGWDDTVNTGIAKVNDFVQGMAKDDNSQKLVNTVLRLLSKDNKGNLKASRVLVLKKLSEDTGDKNFIDAIQIIQDAYRPVPSQEFVRCVYKDAKTGGKKILPLSISEAALSAEECPKPLNGA